MASNLEDKNKVAGRAKSLFTTFTKEKIKWENIFIQGEEEKKEKKKQLKCQIKISSHFI